MSNNKEMDIVNFSEIFKALSNPNRLKIFLRLVTCCQPGTLTQIQPNMETEGCAGDDPRRGPLGLRRARAGEKTMSGTTVYETELVGLVLKARGKVRDIYDLDDRLLIVATDRLSAFDYVLPNPIPDKGKVLNQISAFWFARSAGIVPNHVIATRAECFPEQLRVHAEQLGGRATLARKLEMLPIECVARGYITGSAWKEYQQDGTVCGIWPYRFHECGRPNSVIPSHRFSASSSYGWPGTKFAPVVRL